MSRRGTAGVDVWGVSGTMSNETETLLGSVFEACCAWTDEPKAKMHTKQTEAGMTTAVPVDFGFRVDSDLRIRMLGLAIVTVLPSNIPRVGRTHFLS